MGIGIALLRCWAPLAIILFSFSSISNAVKHQDFKTCDQAGFCKRNRAYADAATAHGAAWKSPYVLSSDSITFKDGKLEGTILKTIARDGTVVRLPLTIAFLASGTVRVTVDEERRQKGDIVLRHNSQARKERYNEAEKWALVGGLETSKDAVVKKDGGAGSTVVLFGPARAYEAVVRHAPFGIDFNRDGETHVRFNDRGFMNVEHWRPKIVKTPPPPEDGKDDKDKTDDKAGDDGEDESTWWEETFGGNTDSKPRGPESVALDISFPAYEHVIGIPEHAGPLSLKETRGGGDGKYTEPYRMYNSDVFEYELDSPMTLYGSIPFMQAQRAASAVGVFWLNAAETWVDIVKTRPAARANPLSLGVRKESPSTQTHWISESGLLDVFVFLGPTPRDVLGAYTQLTGHAQLPPLFSLAYHQCRWNYFSAQDVRAVDRRFDAADIPYDVIWLDIEYTDDKKYFTWDARNFRDPVAMQRQLATHGRKLVAIIDPHIKNVADYRVADELKSKGLAVRNKDGAVFEGWCWPGASVWVDCFSAAARRWWAGLFAFDAWRGSTPDTFLWNDMNEPSVFNGPEISMPRDNLHAGSWEHRDVHNLYGLTFANATYHGLLERGSTLPANPDDKNKKNKKKKKKGSGSKSQEESDSLQQQQQQQRRPFVLTRAFFAGSQRAGAMWTGDNHASWPYLAASVPMTLAMGAAGFPNAGADVGGFFGNPSAELLTRWYQTGAFYPFFRAHAHIDSRRREPYLAGAYHRRIIAQAIRLRYQLLPAWYTAFRAASVAPGAPVLRAQYYVFPGDARGFAVDDQFYVGGTGLLAKPVTAEGARSVDVYLADGAERPYYDYFDYTVYASGRRSSSSSSNTVSNSNSINGDAAAADEDPDDSAIGGTGYGSENAGIHSNGITVRVPAPLERIPLLLRGGHIVPRRDRPRRSSGLARRDPFTLLVTLDAAGAARGSIYLDDGETFAYNNNNNNDDDDDAAAAAAAASAGNGAGGGGAYVRRRFVMDAGTRTLRSVNADKKAKAGAAAEKAGGAGAKAGAKAAAGTGAGTGAGATAKDEYVRSLRHVRVEKIIVVGAPRAWAHKTAVRVRVFPADVDDDDDDANANATTDSAATTTTTAELIYHPATTATITVTAAPTGTTAAAVEQKERKEEEEKEEVRVVEKAAWAVVRDPAVGIAASWAIDFLF